MKKALLLSVGNSMAPIVFSINQQQPEFVIFLVSDTTRSVVNDEIVHSLQHIPKDKEIIHTPNEEDVSITTAALLRNLPRLFKLWNIEPKDLTGDFTGGTKAMSAAVALALNSMGCSFSYVGGTNRNKDGKVINGTEILLRMANPWDDMAVDLLRKLEFYFNAHRYLMASELADQAAEGATDRKPFFRSVALACKGYHLWDRFQYNTASNLLNQAYGPLQNMIATNGNQSIRHFKACLESGKELAKKMSDEAKALSGDKNVKADMEYLQHTSLLVQDLLANARRRGTMGAYDDAVSRLYSAVEKFARIRLLKVHGVDNSNVEPSNFSQKNFGAFFSTCIPSEDGKIKLGLFKSYELLSLLGDELGEQYVSQKEELTNLMSLRNTSILAHGFAPVEQQTFEKMFQIVLGFTGLKEPDLHQFPEMHWEGLFI